MSPSPSEQHPGPKATVEERLWVRLRDGGGEAFIVGEGHTHRDRFAIRARGEAESRLCSQYELAQVSVAAADWLSGFLHGRLPRPPEDPKLMTEWREKREIFLRCGAWPGRSEYHHYGTGHALSECAEVRVEPTEGADPELAAVRGHLGVVVDLLEAEPADRSPTYFVMLDAQAAAESEGWAIEEQDLNPTGKHRPDYDPAPRFTCPCCGFLTLPDPERGSYEICPVCFWEDDAVQLASPTLGGGANAVSLNEARQNFARHGVSEPRFHAHVRHPAAWEYPPPEVVSARPVGP